MERRLLEHAAAMGSVFCLGGLVALAHEAVESEGAKQGEVGKESTPVSDRETAVVCGRRGDHCLRIGDGGG